MAWYLKRTCFFENYDDDDGGEKSGKTWVDRILQQFSLSLHSRCICPTQNFSPLLLSLPATFPLQCLPSSVSLLRVNLLRWRERAAIWRWIGKTFTVVWGKSGGSVERERERERKKSMDSCLFQLFPPHTPSVCILTPCPSLSHTQLLIHPKLSTFSHVAVSLPRLVGMATICMNFPSEISSHRDGHSDWF